MMAEKNSKRFDGIRLIAYLCTIKSGQKEKMKKCLLLIISLLTAVMAVGQTQHFFTSDELSSNQITQICRDRVGYIWVGTEFGLNKYDGYRFTNYFHETDNPATISSNVISFLFVDSQGNLWVGTQMGLDRYDDARDEFIHVRLDGAKGVPRIN